MCYDTWKLATPPEYEYAEGPEEHEPPCPHEAGCVVCDPDKEEPRPCAGKGTSDPQ